MKVSLSMLDIYKRNSLEELALFKSKLEYLHVDVMDGKFVPNTTFDAGLLPSLWKYNFILDTHLLIDEPEKYYLDYIKAGSKYITFHLEASQEPQKLIDLIHKHNALAGLSIKPNTQVETLKEFLPYLDMVLIMSVEPGFGGQEFMTNSIDKVKYLKEQKEKNNYKYLISIDGGINIDSIALVKDYVDLVVCGSYITRSDKPLERLEKIKNI